MPPLSGSLCTSGTIAYSGTLIETLSHSATVGVGSVSTGPASGVVCKFLVDSVVWQVAISKLAMTRSVILGTISVVCGLNLLVSRLTIGVLTGAALKKIVTHNDTISSWRLLLECARRHEPVLATTAKVVVLPVTRVVVKAGIEGTSFVRTAASVVSLVVTAIRCRLAWV